MSEQELLSFIRSQVETGKGKKDIVEQLTSVGWSEDEAEVAYARTLTSMGVPTPQEGERASFSKKVTTLEVVVNLFSFILLSIVAFALGALYFEVIDKYFPDAINDNSKSSYSYTRSSSVSSDIVHYSIAALVIGFPLLFFALRFWFRKFRKDSGKVESRLTKWITYLVLLVASVTIVGDLIAIVYTFLQGEISARFFLKALIILVIAGSIFGFYFFERKYVQYKKAIHPLLFRSYVVGVGSMVLVGIILGFVVAGSPAMERKRTLDDKREQNLSQIESCIDSYTYQFKKLPDSLDDLTKASLGYISCPDDVLTDPETGQFYEYEIINASSPYYEENTIQASRKGTYKLCATFALSSEESSENGRYYYSSDREDIWEQHSAGRECDTVEATWRIP